MRVIAVCCVFVASQIACGGAIAPERALHNGTGDAGWGAPSQGDEAPAADGGEPVASGDATIGLPPSQGEDAGNDAVTAETGIAPGDGGQAATAFLINPAHTGAIDDPSLTPPLARIWDVDLGAEPTYPLIADGRVYAVTTTGNVSAFDNRTGDTVWAPAIVSASGGSPMATYEGGRLFVLTWGGALSAFDGATGNVLWTYQFPQNVFFDSPPTAYAGNLYVAHDATLYALDEASGGTLWTANIGGGDYSSPAASAQGVFVAYAGPQVYCVAPETGAPIWHYAGSESGGGGETPILVGNSLYVMDISGDPERVVWNIRGNVPERPPPSVSWRQRVLRVLVRHSRAGRQLPSDDLDIPNLRCGRAGKRPGHDLASRRERLCLRRLHLLGDRRPRCGCRDERVDRRACVV